MKTFFSSENISWGNTQKTRTTFILLILIPIFLLVSLSSSNIYDARKQDFAAYWQAGYMVLSGQDIYNSSEWIAERQQRGTALHSEPTFHYPLPFAVLFSPLALFPVESAYTLWLFFGQIAIVTSILILLSFYPARTGYFELFTIAGIFLFRPSFSVIFNGQILSLLLIFVCVSILLFHNQDWFWGGFALSLLSLKPSIGLPILALAGLWLLAKKQWPGILGIALGCITLLLAGMLIDPNWPIEYIRVSGDSFSKYFGLHPTMWGVVDKIFIKDTKSLVAGAVVSLTILVTEVYVLNRRGTHSAPIEAFASILPAGLLIAPYSWSYDQILLAVPLIYLMIRVASSQGNRMAVLFLFGIVTLSIFLVFAAHGIHHDVWSFLNSFIVWIFVLCLIPRSDQSSRVRLAGGE